MVRLHLFISLLYDYKLRGKLLSVSNGVINGICQPATYSLTVSRKKRIGDHDTASEPYVLTCLRAHSVRHIAGQSVNCIDVMSRCSL